VVRKWSYSALTQYLRCPLQFFFQRILSMPPPFTPSGLILGSAIHESLAVYHRGLKDKKPVAPEAIKDAFLEAWKSRISKEKVALDAGNTETKILDQGIALLEAYLQEPPPQNIVAVEREMTAAVHNSDGEVLKQPMTAIIDLLTLPESGLKITDLKTSSRSYSEMEAAISLQATCYANAVHANFGQLASFEYAVLVKIKKPRVQRLETSRSEPDFGRLGDLVQNVDRAVELGVFYPNESPLNYHR
jgi:putative RecB family exonuclease